MTCCGSKSSIFLNFLLYFLYVLLIFEESCLICTAILLLCLPAFLFYKAIALLTTFATLFGFGSIILRMGTWREVHQMEKLQAIKSPPEIFLNASRALMTWSALIAWFWLNYTFKFNDFVNTRWFISVPIAISFYFTSFI
ncbi:Uncharacterized protein BM_BM1146 [Brugia malayi]|uniref:Bm1146 n=1 Tax=Brugia malayi TaxID=6279 RepID=A0A0K0IRS6_BRUMA|nr:Uncharacterized protein BM_BM1146 [Brugia malayi]CDP91682.1 Bm1146 [Brugia malayi]VIO93474.1 Uncharacterized protein BM_BM1146 [Brugia malayi]